MQPLVHEYIEASDIEIQEIGRYQLSLMEQAWWRSTREQDP